MVGGGGGHKNTIGLKLIYRFLRQCYVMLCYVIFQYTDFIMLTMKVHCLVFLSLLVFKQSVCGEYSTCVFPERLTV